MVGADLECLVPTHDQPSLSVLLVLEQSNVTSTTLLPFSALAVELEQLGAHTEGLLLELLVGLCVDLFRQAVDGLKVYVCLFFRSFIIL